VIEKSFLEEELALLQRKIGVKAYASWWP